MTKDLFRASAMCAEAPVAFEEMKFVADLKAGRELVARAAWRGTLSGAGAAPRVLRRIL